MCGKVLRAIYATIKKHLQTVHALSFKEYATQYQVFKVKNVHCKLRNDVKNS